jgi:hypothetical protein
MSDGENLIPLRVIATRPLQDFPVWAVLERRLFDALDEAWRLFDATYTDDDGGLVYGGRMRDRDGVDDFYEPFFNWPTLYRLGGSTDLLAAAKHHWEGVTRQMTAFGFVRDEFEVGYDWFHQGESLLFFYGICAADPGDEAFRRRAIRFAELYLAESPAGNYDGERKLIRAPHTGSGGPRYGLGEVWQEYSGDQSGMRRYGLPLRDLPGIDGWDDLDVGDNARRMGQAMQERLGRGDVAVNLGSTALMANAWLFGHDTRFAAWIREYVGAWRQRAARNMQPGATGVIPDNFGPSGVVGEDHDGAWFGGHYGWTWPHGLYSVEAAVMIASVSELLVDGEPAGLELARTPLRTVLEHSMISSDIARQGSLGPGWAQKLAVSDSDELLLVPYRIDADGWFDFHPLPLTYPMWLWWLTGSAEDRELLRTLNETGGYDWSIVHRFHDKEEQGHEAPWLTYLFGENPSYPEEALSLALAQVARRVALIRQTPHGPPDGDIHWWQRLNPVVVEVLLQLTTGSPPALYNGGLQLARVLYGDALAGRPGLPPDVAALVTEVDAEGVALDLVNLSVLETREVFVQAGAFAEDRIDTVGVDVSTDGYPGSSRDYRIPPEIAQETATLPATTSRLVVVLAPLTRISLRLEITRRVFTPTHTSF